MSQCGPPSLAAASVSFFKNQQRDASVQRARARAAYLGNNSGPSPEICRGLGLFGGAHGLSGCPWGAHGSPGSGWVGSRARSGMPARVTRGSRAASGSHGSAVGHARVTRALGHAYLDRERPRTLASLRRAPRRGIGSDVFHAALGEPEDTSKGQWIRPA